MRRGLIVLACLAVVGSAGWVVQTRRRASARDDAIARADLAWAVLQKCLIGEPLREGDRATVRLRRVAGRGDGKDWPQRCAAHARALKREVLSVQDVPRFSRMPLYLFELEDDLEQGRLPRDADELWQAAALAQLGRRSAPIDVPGPPGGVAPPVEPGRLAVLADGAAHAVAPIGGSPLRVLFRRPARLCVFAADARTARCRAVKDELAGAEVVDAEDGAPPVVRVLEPERGGVWSPAGERLTKAPVTAAYSFADGSLGFVDWTAEKGYELHHARAGAAEARMPLIDGEDFRFLGDRLVWRTAHGPETTRLVTTQVPRAPGDFASVLVLGAVAQGSRVEACRAGETRAVVAAPAVAPRCDVQVALALDGRWLPSLLSTGVEHGLEAWRVDCRAGMATVTWTRRAEGSPADEVEAHQLRCDLTGCGQMEARLAGVGRGAPPIVADLEGKLLAVWYHDDDSVRMRLGDLVDLQHAPEVVILDAERHGGLDVEGLELYVQPGAAVLLIGSAKGTRAVRIDPSGLFEGVEIVDEK